MRKRLFSKRIVHWLLVITGKDQQTNLTALLDDIDERAIRNCGRFFVFLWQLKFQFYPWFNCCNDLKAPCFEFCFLVWSQTVLSAFTTNFWVHIFCKLRGAFSFSIVVVVLVMLSLYCPQPYIDVFVYLQLELRVFMVSCRCFVEMWLVVNSTYGTHLSWALWQGIAVFVFNQNDNAHTTLINKLFLCDVHLWIFRDIYVLLVYTKWKTTIWFGLHWITAV